MLNAIAPAQPGARLQETWSPRVIAELDDSTNPNARSIDEQLRPLPVSL